MPDHGLQVLKNALRLSRQFLHVVHIGLIILNTLELLLDKLKAKESEQNSLNERKDRCNESVGIIRFDHVWFRFVGHEVVKGKNHHNNQHGSSNSSIKHEQDKELEIALSNAIVDPGAVVVHLEDAVAALLAMVRSFRFPSFVRAALTVFVSALLKVLRLLEAVWNVARVRPSSPLVGKNGGDAEEVEEKSKDNTGRSEG